MTKLPNQSTDAPSGRTARPNQFDSCRPVRADPKLLKPKVSAVVQGKRGRGKIVVSREEMINDSRIVDFCLGSTGAESAGRTCDSISKPARIRDRERSIL